MTFNDWKEVSLNEVILFNPRESLKKGTIAKKIGMDKLSEFQRKITGYEYSEFKSGTKFRNGDTLLARITPCLENGKTAQVDILDQDEVAFGSTEFIVMREIPEKSYNDFIYYLSISDKLRNIAIKSMTGTSGRQRAQKDVIEKTKISIPLLNEQKSIANILSTLDDKKETNNKINEKLEEMAQALFKHWFVDFEFPNENGEPYKSSGGEMIESELGMIPKDWKVTKLDELIDLFDSKRIPLSKNERDKREKIYPYYGASSLMDYVDDYIFDGIYVLLGEDGTVVDDLGYPILQYVWGKFWVNNHAHVIKGKDDYSDEFVYMVLKNTKVSSAVTGAVQLKINQKNLKSLLVIIPENTDLIKQFSSVMDYQFSIIRNNSNENKALTSIRDTLLPKLMSGEIRVPLDNEF
ncbi:restriction endonuclease subunit S [Oceanobacillus salinisoli]|uniref:restriction endonuclease subunit S n=1 Tax=Oceanobacillus salinisoli TaxID=2678611 RepID=UPI0012E192E1|nr:restriction endonuclease subunit S [Oceanobacillus salinisoli]